MLGRPNLYGFRERSGARDNRFPRWEAHVKRIPWTRQWALSPRSEGKQTLNGLQRKRRETGRNRSHAFASPSPGFAIVRKRPGLTTGSATRRPSPRRGRACPVGIREQGGTKVPALPPVRGCGLESEVKAPDSHATVDIGDVTLWPDRWQRSQMHASISP